MCYSRKFIWFWFHLIAEIKLYTFSKEKIQKLIWAGFAVSQTTVYDSSKITTRATFAGVLIGTPEIHRYTVHRSCCKTKYPIPSCTHVTTN